ncbi:hypothetical protein AX16_005325 [Volvariella volvacea WC 439]|nr:hypothetical protein AX16_005325 [Volvariella volvacea WC 439]
MGVQAADKEPKQKKKPGRAPTSCAECRRLKLRCDRQVPCEKCVSRGCGAICPDGSLTPGRGGKLVLANTEELHDRIDRLCGRIRELEDALRSLHANHSSQPHPLLTLELLQLKGPENFNVSTTSLSSSSKSPSNPPPSSQPSDSRSPSIPNSDDGGEESLIDAFGTLTVGVNGESLFLGKTARSEYLIRAPIPAQAPVNLALPCLSRRVLESVLPDTGISNEELGRELFNHLPPMSEASHLCEVYLEHGRYLYTALPRREVWDEILAPLYRSRPAIGAPCQSHALALIFIIFALGALFDPHREPYSASAHEYYRLARTTLNLAPPVTETTLASIQTLIHMAQFLDLSDPESRGSNIAWTYIGHAVRLGHSIGLHINAKRWGLDEENVQRRSRVFWPLVVLDSWTSFGFGRPPSISLPYVDCAYPQDPDPVVNANGQKEMGYEAWTWRFTSLLQSVMASAFGAKHPPYATIIDLDRQIRDSYVPEHLRPVCDGGMVPPRDHILVMQRWIVLSAKEWMLLNLHRAYFAHALQEAPNRLDQHKYYPSVIAIYRSAWRIIRGLESTWKVVPLLLSRVSLAWSQGLSAAIIICLLITRAPKLRGNPNESLDELDRLVALFQQAAPQCRSADNLLEFMQKLQKKAHEGFDRSQSPQDSSLSPAELDRLGGKTHLISRSSPTPPCATADYHTPSPEAGPPGSSAPRGLHPTLVRDMRYFDPTTCVTGTPLYDTPAPQSQHAQDIQMHLPDFFGSQHATSGFPTIYQQMQTPNVSTTPAPVLDSTWQSFIEQLGF